MNKEILRVTIDAIAVIVIAVILGLYWDPTPVIETDKNEWIYGTWRCSTPYGTIEVIIQDNGRMYDGIKERWHDYTIEGDRIIEQLNGGISSYNIDRANKRFDCGEPGYWFRKVE